MSLRSSLSRFDITQLKSPHWCVLQDFCRTADEDHFNGSLEDQIPGLDQVALRFWSTGPDLQYLLKVYRRRHHDPDSGPVGDVLRSGVSLGGAGTLTLQGFTVPGVLWDRVLGRFCLSPAQQRVADEEQDVLQHPGTRTQPSLDRCLGLCSI